MTTDAAQAPDQTTATQPQASVENLESSQPFDPESWHDNMLADLSAGKVPDGVVVEEDPGEKEGTTQAEDGERTGEESGENADEGKPDGDGEGDGESQESESHQSRPRLRATNEVEALAFQIKKTNRDWSLSKCEAQARIALGVQDEGEGQAEGDSGKTEGSGEISTSKELEGKIEELRAKRKQAKLDFDAETETQLDDEIDKLIDMRSTVRENEAKRSQSVTEEFDKKFDDSWDQAAKFYPDMQNEGSEFSKTMAEIDKELKASKSPLFTDPEKPLVIAHMAAKKLLIAPATVKTPARQPKPVNPLVKGSASSSQPTTADAISKEISQISDPDELADLGRKLGISLG